MSHHYIVSNSSINAGTLQLHDLLQQGLQNQSDGDPSHSLVIHSSAVLVRLLVHGLFSKFVLEEDVQGHYN